MRSIHCFLVCAVRRLFRAHQTQPTLQTYSNAKLGFKIQYLSIWKVSEAPKPWIAVRFSPPEGSDSHARRGRHAAD